MNLNKKLNFVVVIAFVFAITGCSSSDSSFTIKGASSSSSATAVVTSETSGSPTSLLMTVYAAYISLNADCSSPILLQDYGSAGHEFNMFSSPTLFSGSPADGTYECLILKIKDTMSFKVDATAVADHPACTDTTTEHVFDVYRDGNSDDGLQVDLDGALIDARGTAATGVADTIYVFASTGVAGIVRANGVAINENQYVALQTALVVPSNLFFYFDMSDGVATHSEASVDYCWLEGTDSSGFGFR